MGGKTDILEGLARKLFNEFGLDVSESMGTDEAAIMFRELKGNHPEGRYAIIYYHSVPSSEGPDEDIEKPAGPVRFNEMEEKLKNYSKTGPYFERLSYLGAVNANVCRSVPAEGDAKLSLTITVPREKVKKYLKSSLRNNSNTHVRELSARIAELSSRNEPLRPGIADMSYHAKYSVRDLEELEDFMRFNINFRP